MKDKGLFAKTGIAKIMALLATLLTMFASCNFLGGEDVRMPTAGSNDPGKFNGMFKSVISGLGIQIYNEGKAFSIDSKGNLVFKTGWSGAYGSYDENGASTTGKYDVSNVAYVQYDLKSYSKGTFGIIVFGDSQNKNEQTFAEDEFLENEMVVRNVKIDIENKKEYSEILFSLSGKMGYGSKVRIENFAFYDENGKEVVPKYIKYADGEKPGDGDPDDNPGEGSTFSGVFKNPIPGQIDIGIWDNSFTCDNLPELVARDDAWWGGAFGWVEQEPEWSMPRNYDVSGIVRCSFDVVATTDVSGVYVTAFPAVDYKGQNGPADSYCETDWEDKEEQRKVTLNLQAGGKQRYEMAFDAVSGRSTNRASLIGFSGNGSGTGGTLSIINITFYDSTGKEVVPKIAGEGGDTPDVPDDDSTKLTLDGIAYSYKVWFAEWEWRELTNQPTVEQSNDGIKLTVNDANNAADWHGQFKLFGDVVDIVKDTNYDINVVVRTTKDTQGVTLKPTVKDKEDEGMFGQFKKDFKANEDVKFECNKVTAKESGTLAVVFNFHGCNTGTEIFIKSLTFKKSTDQTKDDFLVGGNINANGTGGDIQFPFADIPDASEYHLYIGDSATPARVFRSDIDGGQRRIEIKPAFKKESNLLEYPYCRKVGEVFPNGAGEYEIKIVPVIGDKEDASKAMTSKYTLTADKTGWMPKIEGVVLNPQPIETSGKLTITFAYSVNPEIGSFNVFVKKRDVPRDTSQGKWGGVNPELIVKNGDNILERVSNLQDVFKSGAGMYEIYFEPVKTDGTIGTNIALSELDVKESWLN